MKTLRCGKKVDVDLGCVILFTVYCSYRLTMNNHVQTQKNVEWKQFSSFGTAKFSTRRRIILKAEINCAVKQKACVYLLFFPNDVDVALRGILAWKTTPTAWIKLLWALWRQVQCNKRYHSCVWECVFLKACECVVWMTKEESVSDIRSLSPLQILHSAFISFHAGSPTLGCDHIFSHLSIPRCIQMLFGWCDGSSQKQKQIRDESLSELFCQVVLSAALCYWRCLSVSLKACEKQT